VVSGQGKYTSRKSEGKEKRTHVKKKKTQMRGEGMAGGNMLTAQDYLVLLIREILSWGLATLERNGR